MRPRLYVSIRPASRQKYFEAVELQRITADYETVFEERDNSLEPEREHLADCEVLLTGWGGCSLDEEHYAAAPHLRLVACFGGSVKHLSPEAAWRRKITIINCAAGMVDSMAESTVGMLLALGYQMSEADHRLRRRGEFEHTFPLSRGLMRKTVGLVGMGHIGRRVAVLLREGFQCRVLANDPYLPPERRAIAGVEWVDGLADMMPRVAALTIHAGWTPETTGLMTRELLALLPDGALVAINARLPIVDEPALAAEARSGRLGVAVNQIPRNPKVWETAELRELPNLLYTSGEANVSDVYAGGMSRMIADELVRYVRGEPLKQVVTPNWVRHTT